MAYSYIQYTGNGTQRDFAFAFPYFNTSDIAVTVNGVAVPFTWTNSNTVNITTAPVSGSLVLIRRTTPKSVSPVNFTDGSVLLESDLDTLANFALFVTQEAVDTANLSIVTNSSGNWEGNSKIIQNVADPVNPQDVATRGWSLTNAASALAGAVSSAAASAASAAASLASQIASAASAAAALVSQNAAAASAATTAALLLSFRSVFLGAFATDSAAVTFASVNSIALTNGISYENTTTQKVRVYNGLTWADQDSDAQTQSANATASAASAAASASTATTNAGVAVAQAVIATSQAISASNSAAAASAAISKFRNRLINAGFTINQRVYVSNTALSAGTYAHDRWKAGASGGTYTFTQGSAGVPITITITAGSLQQVIEGCNMPDGGTFTLSWVGTAQGRVNGGSYGSSPITVTGLTAGSNCTLEFNTGTLSIPQIEVGSSATGFEYRQYGQEFALCQRYFQKYTQPALRGVVNPTGNGCQRMGMTLPTVMRSTPTSTIGAVSIFDGGATSLVTGIGTDYSTNTTVEYDLACLGGLTAARPAIVYQTGTASLALSSEL